MSYLRIWIGLEPKGFYSSVSNNIHMYQKRNNQLAILALYTGDYTQQLYLREISRAARIPLKTTQDTLSRLVEQRIIKSITRGKHRYFRLNLENIRTRLHLLRAEIHKTFEFLERYPAFEMFLKEMAPDVPLIIFGSFARFEVKKDSDVDLLILSGRKIELPSHVLPHPVHEIRLSEGDFRKGLKDKEALIEEIKEHHIILNCHSFFVNSLWDMYA